jgi:hypothetical protein
LQIVTFCINLVFFASDVIIERKLGNPLSDRAKVDNTGPYSGQAEGLDAEEEEESGAGSHR